METDTAGDSNPSNGRLQSPNLNERKILEFQRADKSERVISMPNCTTGSVKN